jgi:hypothetical protein
MPLRFDLSALFRRRSAKFVLAFLAAVAAITAVTFTVRVRRDEKGSVFTTNNSQPRPRNDVKRVKQVRLWPQFQSTLRALGDRLEAPGKERLILTGTIRRNSGKAGGTPMRMIVELPDKFRLEEQLGNKIRVTAFDGERQTRLERSDEDIRDERDEDEIESLIFDGIDHLFSGQMAGLAKREIGAYLQPNHTTFANYVGPYYNVYEVVDRITHTAANRMQRKLYYFNAKTSLPEIIRYQVERGRGPLNIEVRFADWHNFNGQLIPKTFTRLENGAEALKLSVDAASIQATADDSMFSIPGN